MKAKSIRWLPVGFSLALLLVALGMFGCASPTPPDIMKGPTGTNGGILPVLNIGDTVTVTLSDIPEPPTPEEKPIQSDGTISMPTIGRVQAAGKTPGELEDYIKSLYVPKIYVHLAVTVQTSSHRVYFVRGEVKTPNQIEYLGPTTVTKAITSAGDFTDFADRKHVVLIRTDNRHFTLNCRRILDGKDPDPPIFPGDQIEVPRRWY